MYVHIDGSTYHPRYHDANIEAWRASTFVGDQAQLSPEMSDIKSTSEMLVLFIQTRSEAAVIETEGMETSYKSTYMMWCDLSYYDRAYRLGYGESKYTFWSRLTESIIDATRDDMDKGNFGIPLLNAVQVQSFTVAVPPNVKMQLRARYGEYNEYYDLKNWSYFVHVTVEGFATFLVAEVEHVPRSPHLYGLLEWSRMHNPDLTLRSDYFPGQSKRIFPVNGINLPSNYRNLIITKQLMHPVAPGYNSYSMFMNNFTLQVLENLLLEVEAPLTLDLVIYHTLTTQVLFTMRILRGYSPDTASYIVNVGDSTLKYATMKSPPELMYIGDVKIVTPSQYLPVMDLNDLADNVVYPNAAIAAGMIGGSALSGIGQGISGYFQYKGNKEMNELNWQKKFELEKMNWQQRESMQTQGFDLQRELQSNTFAFQKGMQFNQFDFSKEMQGNQFSQQEKMQRLAFQQQSGMQSYDWDNSFLYQKRNQDFAREMAGYNQSLAGYRTGGAVAGVNTRYHPRTQSGTQTVANDSGRVIGSDPSRWGQGPRSSMSPYGRLATNTIPHNNAY